MIKLIDFSSRFRILKGGKVSLVVSALLTSASIVSASPTGGSVTSGTANITQSGNTTNITQSSNKASINWNKFDIAANETVNFNQPNSSSITLNRVIGNEKSVINGALNANGQVWILNSNGVLFGKNASINTSGILATTKELSDTDFQNGNYDFKGNSSESVINLGTIEVSNNGSVVLAANEVVNQGTIKAVRGKVHLVGADEYTVNLNGNSLVNLIVTKGVLDAMVENSGTISANGGEIYLSTNAVNELLKGVVNNTGILEANSFDDLLASTDDIAGKVVLTGDEITNSGTIQAKGKDGGGEILIGGDWQGSNSDKYKQATTVTLTNTSKIDASAIEKGNGGKVVVWSDVKNKDSVTIAKGSIKANAGINSGDGGKVETSGHTLITSGINLDLTAEKGKGGLWLLDPNNITISGSATTAGATPLPNYESSADSSTVLNSDIVSQLNSGTSVTIQTGSGGSQAGDITVASDIITGDMASEATLTLKAHRNIIVNSGVSIDATQNSNTNKLNITLHSDFEGGYIVSSASLTAGAIQVKDGASIKSNGGDIVLGGGANISTGYALATGSLGTGAGIQLSNVVVDSAGGDITMRGMGQHALGSSTGVILESGTSISSGLGKINITGRSEAFLNSTSGLRNGIRIDNASITSTSTADDAITLSGLEGYGAGSASGGTGSNREGISLTNTNITSAGGVTFAADKQIYNNSTLTTSGSKDSLSITSYENNAFWDAFNWNGTLSGSNFVGSESILGLTINDMANLNGLTIGKATSTSNVAISSAININGPISVYGNNISLNNHLNTSTGNGDILLQANTEYTLNSDVSLSSGSGAITLTTPRVNGANFSDTLPNGKLTINSTGLFTLQPLTNSFNGQFMAGSNSGPLGSGLDLYGTLTSGNFVGTGETAWLKINAVSTLGGLTIGKSGLTNTIASHFDWNIAGDINIYGKDIKINGNLDTSSVANGNVSLTASGYIDLANNKSIITNGGDITFKATASGVGVTGDSAIKLNSGSSLNSTGGNITLGGGYNGTAGAGLYAASSKSGGGYAIDLVTATINAAGGNINLYGSNTTSYGDGVAISASTIKTAGAGAIGIYGDSYGGVKVNGGINTYFGGITFFNDSSVIETDKGNIDITGVLTNTQATNASGINFFREGISGSETIKILSKEGDISINGSKASSASSGIGHSGVGTVYFGSPSDESWIATGDITFSISSMDKSASKGFIVNTTGGVTYQPYADSFDGDFTYPFSSNYILAKNASSLTIGKSTNTSNIIIDSAISIAGDINIYGGNITINNSLTATNTGVITLSGTGNITDGTGGYVIADSLLLLDGAVTFDNILNDVGTIAASGIDSISYLDKDDLEIGTVDSTDGITSTGAIDIATKTGDITVSKNISATNITLNAGKDIAAGISTGGNIIISGTPTITASTGNAKLYTGSVSGSTGLTSFIGSGSAKFRYNSDEISNGFTTALGTTGNYAIYREKPILSGTIDDKTITYADSNPTFTVSNGTIVNGDTLTLVSPVYSTATKLKAGTYTMNASELGGLGYSISGITQTGTLTVDKKALTVVGITAQDKEYNANNTATLSNAGTLNGLISNDLVTFTTASTFNNKNVEATKTLDLDYTLAGTDKDNYSLTDLTAQATSAKITAKELTLSASKTYDGTTSLTGNVTLAGYVGTETLTYTNATVNDAHVATASKYINAITLADGTNGGIATNYKLPTLNNTNAAVTINAKTLTSTITNTGLTKTYDGTTNAPSSFAPTYSFTGLVSGDTNAILAYTSANYNDKDVLDATKITLAGLSINSITGTNSSNISDYILDSNTKDVSASITKANLTVNANNDARFVTQTDNSGFAGASYTGFVAAESSTDIAGSLAITRIDANTNTIAGTYTNKLVASGLTSDNYSFNYVNGDYTIVGANQLLVKVANENNTYGTNTIYNIASAEYLASDNSTIVDLTSNITNSGNTKTIIDGASGSAIFTIAPENLSTSKSTANKLNVGSYQLETSGIVTENSDNFSNVVTLVGSHQVNTKAISANATGVSKVYDGTTSMNEVSLGLDTLETSDVVTVNGLGAFSSKNAGNSLDYTISNLSLSGTDSSNYYLIAGTSLSGNDGTINKKALTISYDANDKVYDGNTTVIVNKTLTGKISGDDISVTQSAAFADKNVDINKTVNVSSIALNGVDKNNYTLASTLTTTADITRLNSVTWIGGNTGNWFDPSNWAGGAIPDLSNVANVVIPTGVVVSFDTNGVVSPADISAVNIDSLGTLGSLTMANGELNIKNSMTLDTFTQNGGILTAGTILTKTYNQTAGSSTSSSLTTDTLTQSGGTTTTDALTVNNSFTQSGTTGQITVNNNANITQTSGSMQIGNLSVGGDLTANANSGDILQVNGTTIDVSGLTTLNTTRDITLNSNKNDFNKLSLNANNATIVDGIGGIVLSDIRTAGNLNIKSLGGDITQTSTSKLNIGNQSTFDSTSNYDVILKNYSNIFTGMINVTANSAIIWSNTKPTWGIINTKTPIVYSGPHDKDIISAQNLITPIANATSVRINENMNLNIGLNNNLSKSNSIIHMESKPTKKVSHDELKTIQEREDTKITLSNISNVNIIGTGVNLPLGLSQEFYLSEDNLKEGI